MATIFISYASEDRDRAEAVARVLSDGIRDAQKRKCTVFWDRTIIPGQKFRKVIDEQIRSADVVVVLWSKAAVESEWVVQEIDEAFEQGRLVPALLEEVRPPRPFGSLQAASLVGWDGSRRAPALDLLIHSIRERLRQERPQQPDPEPAPVPVPIPVPPRRHPANSFLVGALLLLMAAGLAVLGPAWWRPRLVLVVGSGTVSNCLEEIGAPTFERLGPWLAATRIDTPTDAGVRLFSTAYGHGEARPDALPIIAMASSPQSADVFAGSGKRLKFVEIPIALDTLTVVLGARSVDSLSTAFGGAFAAIRAFGTLGGVGRGIPLKEVARHAWRGGGTSWSSLPGYAVYLTSDGSATRDAFMAKFRSLPGLEDGRFPDDWKHFDQEGTEPEGEGRPWLAFSSVQLTGSRIAGKFLRRIAGPGGRTELPVLGADGLPLTRELLLYARVSTAWREHRVPGARQSIAGFDLDPRVARYLAHLFGRIERNARRHGDSATLAHIQTQREFLHLTSGWWPSAWVSQQPGGSNAIHVYRSAR